MKSALSIMARIIVVTKLFRAGKAISWTLQEARGSEKESRKRLRLKLKRKVHGGEGLGEKIGERVNQSSSKT